MVKCWNAVKSCGSHFVALATFKKTLQLLFFNCVIYFSNLCKSYCFVLVFFSQIKRGFCNWLFQSFFSFSRDVVISWFSCGCCQSQYFCLDISHRHLLVIDVAEIIRWGHIKNHRPTAQSVLYDTGTSWAFFTIGIRHTSLFWEARIFVNW
jgi:hypothetical protein